MAHGTMWRAPSGSVECCPEWWRAVSAATIAVLVAGCGPFGPRPASATGAEPVRVHAAAGWGRPAVQGASVYYLSKAHELFAIDRASGRERWRRLLSPGSGLTAGVNVVVSRDVVIAGDGHVFAFDAGSGEHRWRFAPEGDLPGRFIGDVADEVVLVGSTNGTVSALRVATGEVVWRSSLRDGRTTVFAPVVSGELVVLSWTAFDDGRRSGGLAALSVRDGRLRWRTRFPYAHALLAASAAGPPTTVGDLVVGAATDGIVYAVSRVDGSVAWTLPAVPPMFPGGEHEDARFVAPAGPLLLVTSSAGVLSAVNPHDQREVWRYTSPPDGSVGFGLAIRGALAFAPFGSGRLLVIDAQTGRAQRWLGGPAQRFDWLPAWAPERSSREVYLVREDGLYVFDTEPAH